jgi:hypothetical protein
MKVLRNLDGISYWVLEDTAEIAELVNVHIRREWESDIAEQKDHEGGKWLGTIQTRDWGLEVVEMTKIMLSMSIMNYSNEETGYNFRKRLEERKNILRRDLERFGAVIRPLILRGEDMQLMDGYCRYHVLSDRDVPRAYAYIGTL